MAIAGWTSAEADAFAALLNERKIMQPVEPTPVPVSETPAEFVARLGVKVDEAWRAWNEDVPRRMSRTAFREAVRNPES